MSYIQTFLRPCVMSHHPVQALNTMTLDEHPNSQQSLNHETNHLNNDNVTIRTFDFR
jgi:hypothetical protein